LVVGDEHDLVCQAPAPPPLPTRDDLHGAIHPHTSTADLRSYLRWQEAERQAALTAGIPWSGRQSSITVSMSLA
jgi:hypothetical protein